MPGPWRPNSSAPCRPYQKCFNLNRDARPLASSEVSMKEYHKILFQSQPRCQAPGDTKKWNLGLMSNMGFNLNRDARPLATCAGIKWKHYTDEFQSQPRCQAP